MLAFARGFGTLAKEAQLAECDKLLAVLTPRAEECKADEKNRVRISVAAGFAVGAGILILIV